jgi:hypothetical protein
MLPLPATSPLKLTATIGLGLLSIFDQSTLASISPFVPLNTSLLLVASGIKVNLPVLLSYPKKPILASFFSHECYLIRPNKPQRATMQFLHT